MVGHEGSLFKHVLRDHVFIGGLAAAACLRFWSPLYCLAFWLSNILIDVDHYLEMLYWSDFKARRFHQVFHWAGHVTQHNRQRPFVSLEPFHTLEAVALAALLGYGLGVGIFRAILGGMIFHIAVDVVHLGRKGTLRLRAHSFPEFWLRKRRMERRGEEPTRLQREAGQIAARCCPNWRWPLI